MIISQCSEGKLSLKLQHFHMKRKTSLTILDDVLELVCQVHLNHLQSSLLLQYILMRRNNKTQFNISPAEPEVVVAAVPPIIRTNRFTISSASIPKTADKGNNEIEYNDDEVFV